MEYKEIPAFETNEFKKGDIVRCYTLNSFWQSKVLDVKEDTVGVEVSSPFGTNTIYFHFKQCRKLKENS